MYFRLIVIILIAAFFIIDCSNSVSKKESHNTNSSLKSSLIFGYIDMKNAPGKELTGIHARRYPFKPKIYLDFEIDKGNLFWYSSVVKPGPYQIEEFYSYDFIQETLEFGSYVYNFSISENKTAIRVKKPGIYFMGSYRYVMLKNKRSDYDLITITNPSKKDLLIRLRTMFIKMDKNKYSKQIKMITDNLKTEG